MNLTRRQREVLERASEGVVLTVNGRSVYVGDMSTSHNMVTFFSAFGLVELVESPCDGLDCYRISDRGFRALNDPNFDPKHEPLADPEHSGIVYGEAGFCSPIKRRQFASVGDNPHKRKMQNHMFAVSLRNYRRRRAGDLLRVLCLPGQDAWDIEYFRNEPNLEKVVGLEFDSEIAGELSRRYSDDPRVEIRHTTTTEYLYETTEDFDYVYLDYFSNLNLSVFYDLDLVFSNKVVRPRGKLIVSFFAARETSRDIVVQSRYCRDLYRHLGHSWEPNLSADKRRILALHGYLAEVRRQKQNPLSLSLGFYVAAKCPIWYSHATETAKMLTAYVGVTSYSSNAMQRKSGWASVASRWMMTDKKYFPRHYEDGHLLSVTKSRANKGKSYTYRGIWIKRILAFYEKYKYAPHSVDMTVTWDGVKINKFRQMVIDAGLCPRQRPTRDQIKSEILRIHEREGYVSLPLLRAAKIPKDYLWFSANPWIPEFLTELGVPKELQTNSARRNYFQRVESCKKFLKHLSLGRPLNKLRVTRYLKEAGIAYEGAKKIVAEYESRKDAGEFSMLTGVEIP